MSTLVAITHDDPFAARDIRLTWIKSHREKLHREYGIDMEGVIQSTTRRDLSVCDISPC